MLTHKQIAEAYTQGRRSTVSFNKSPSQATGSGIWYDLSMSSGNPIAQYYSGVSLTSTKLARSTDVGLNHGQPVGSGFKKFLHAINIQSVLATSAPLTLELMDYLMFYPNIAMDAGVQAFTNSISLPRYSTGVGVQMMLVEQFPYAGAATLQVTYTNSAGVGNRLSPIVTLNSQTVFGTVATSAPTTRGASGLFIPLQDGDLGVKSVEQIEFFGAGDVGVLALVLVHPLVAINIFEVTAPSKFDLFEHFKVIPQIMDDAYLNFVCLPTGTLAGANLVGEITTIWSPV